MTDTLITPALRCRVERAACELDTHEFDEGTNHATYNRLYSEANAENAPFRKALAEAIYLYGNAHLRGSRAFDNCFEMCDGDEIVTYLVERVHADPELHAAITRDFGGTLPDSWLRTAAKAIHYEPSIGAANLIPAPQNPCRPGS